MTTERGGKLHEALLRSDGLDEEDLVRLANEAAKMLKERRATKARVMGYQLHKGMKVTTKGLRRIPDGSEGIVLEVRRTKAIVDVSGWGRWTIPMSALSIKKGD